MPYSKSLAARVRQTLRDHPTVERKMFGGLCFMLRGHMLVCVWNDALIVRVGLESYAEALASPHVREFNVTGRPMTGWVLVEPEGIDLDRQLAEWVERAMSFVRTLPPK
jgi:TfoX/Sxy family transcriptional regulator of competence genes